MTWTLGSMDEGNLNPREQNGRLLLYIITVENGKRSGTRKERICIGNLNVQNFKTCNS